MISSLAIEAPSSVKRYRRFTGLPGKSPVIRAVTVTSGPETSTAMLRTRLFLGLLPVVLLIVVTGGYAIYVGRYLAATFSRDLVNNYAAISAAQ